MDNSDGCGNIACFFPHPSVIYPMHGGIKCHTYATRALEAGIPPKVVSEIPKLNHLFDNSTPQIKEDEPERIRAKNKSRVLTRTKSREMNLEI